MKRSEIWSTLIMLSVIAAAPAHQQALQAADVVQRVAAQNASLQSYSARIAFDINLHAFVAIHPTLHATYYFKRPDKAELDFDTVPALAQQFEHLYASLASPDTWPAIYNIRFSHPPLAGKPYELTMVPKKTGNVDRVLVSIDPRNAAIVRMEWRYKNGSWIVLQQTNGKIGDYVLPQGQIGDFNLPAYKAHIVATYSDYRINIPIPDSVFKQ